MRLAIALVVSLLASAASAQGLGGLDPRASVPLSVVAGDHAPGSCHVQYAANGMGLPDPTCSPGAINPTLTIDVLLDPAFRTGMVRDHLTSAAAKRRVYAWYGITPPKHNTGQNQTCELDHVVDIGVGGADSLANIWPQCERPGAPPVQVGDREFKLKDRFAEYDVMRQIKAGGDLSDLQRRIAQDWTQFIEAPGPISENTCAKAACELNFALLPNGNMSVLLTKARAVIIGPVDVGPFEWNASTIAAPRTAISDLVGAIMQMAEQGR